MAMRFMARKGMCIVAVGCVGVSACREHRGTSLEGVWRVTSHSAEQSTNDRPQPNLYVFTKRYYSIVQVNSAEARPTPQADVATATSAQLVAVYGPAFSAHAGTYEYSSGQVTLHPIVAKNPSMMASTATIGFRVESEGDALVLTGSPGGMVFKLTRVE